MRLETQPPRGGSPFRVSAPTVGLMASGLPENSGKADKYLSYLSDRYNISGIPQNGSGSCLVR